MITRVLDVSGTRTEMVSVMVVFELVAGLDDGIYDATICP